MPVLAYVVCATYSVQSSRNTSKTVRMLKRKRLFIVACQTFEFSESYQSCMKCIFRGIYFYLDSFPVNLPFVSNRIGTKTKSV
jgi:hypothetical protein